MVSGSNVRRLHDNNHPDQRIVRAAWQFNNALNKPARRSHITGGRDSVCFDDTSA
jgi:hypothetical protein